MHIPITPLPAPSQPNYTRWFYALVILHVVLWTLLPTLLRHTLPMDALEGFVWGQSWELGYDRNPWLNAWLTHSAVAIGGSSGWLVYLCSQLAVVGCFSAVWQLGKKFLHPLYALAAVFILEGAQYYNLAAVDFNDNVLELGLWAALALFFYNALTQQKLRDWLLTGFFAALALMAKYYAAAIFVPMFLLLIATAPGRASFKKSGLYLGLLLFFVIVLPHFIWLWHHDFVTFNYAVMRGSDGGFSNSAWRFAVAQLLAFTPPLILLVPLWIGKRANTATALSAPHPINNFAKFFIVAIGLGPFILTVVLAALLKISLHAMWGTPLLSLWGLVILTLIQPRITRAKFYRFVAIIAVVFFGILSVYSYGLVYVGYESSATYPGAAIASALDKTWSNRYTQQPHYVIGDRYVAGNVAYFMPRKLKVCIWDDKIYTCDSDALVRQKGAIFVWQIRTDHKKAEVLTFISKIKERFPTAIFLAPQEFQWIYHPHAPTLSIGVAFLPPSLSTSPTK